MKLTQAIAATAEVLGTELSSEAIAMMVEDLAEHPSAAVEAALTRCRREVRGRLTLADILDRLPKDPKAVPTDPEEAWNLAVKLLGNVSEAATVVVPEAIMQSFPYGEWDAGDKVGARMAFKAAYPDNRDRCGNQWTVTEGTDKASREAVVLEAVEMGRISARAALRILPGSAKAHALVAEQRKRLEAVA